MTFDRRILPDLLPNTRDLGGLRTDCGRLLRARIFLRTATLAGLDPSSARKLTAMTGPAIYVDLRTDPEVARDGGPVAALSNGWRWHRYPIQDKAPGDDADSPEDFLRRYVDTLPLYLTVARQVAALFGTQPVVVGCALGKDRTGLVVALLLTWLGINRDAILADFVASNRQLAAGRSLLSPRWHNPAAATNEVSAAICAEVLELAGHRMAAGPDEDVLDTMRACLLAPDTGGTGKDCDGQS